MNWMVFVFGEAGVIAYDEGIMRHRINRVLTQWGWLGVMLLGLGLGSTLALGQTTLPGLPPAQTQPAPPEFSALFPAPTEGAYHSAGEAPGLTVFDPLLTGLLKRDAHGPRGQGLPLDDEVAQRLVQQAPPTTAPGGTWRVGDTTVMEQLITPNAPEPEAPPSQEEFGFRSYALIGAGVALLVTVGVIHFRHRIFGGPRQA